MSYIGNTNTTQAFTSAIDYFSGNGSTTAFTLSRPVASVAQVQVHIDNVAQNPSTAFTVLNNTITFTSAPLSGTNNIYVQYTSPITQITTVSQGAIGPAQLDYANFNGTGSMTLPSGTTAQRPASPTNGMMRYNTTGNQFEMYQNSTWVGVSSGYLIEYLVVAGGGAGGTVANGSPWAGGGGGAGGYLSATGVYTTTGTAYTVTVGAGGASSNSNGSNSSFGSLATATGGGAGGNVSNGNGTAGGSGGGGSAAGSGGAGTSGQGYAGGAGSGASANSAAGGGGGANAVGGTSAGSGSAGAGGAGKTWSNGTTYAGGGGGSTESGAGYGAGGVGGGGAGAINTTVSGTAGTANTGGGGGGATRLNTVSAGGAGGSGVVIIRYPGIQFGTGGTVTSAGGYTYHTFTTSGTFTA